MVFTLEQNKFIIMSYYRNGIKRDGEWTYSVQACKEEFLANYPDLEWYIRESRLDPGS
jgi:cellobiose phosphorylase